MKKRHLLCTLAALSLSLPLWANEGNLIPNGDAENGEVFFKALPEAFEVSVFEGNPVGENDNELQGKACYKVVLLRDQTERNTNFPVGQFAIDNAKTYRVSVRVWSSDEVLPSIGGYSFGENRGNPLKVPETEKVWGYSLKNSSGSAKLQENPGWSVFETTVGPKGSAATHQWSDEAIFISYTVWLRGPQGATVYFDDFRVEPVENGAEAGTTEKP